MTELENFISVRCSRCGRALNLKASPDCPRLADLAKLVTCGPCMSRIQKSTTRPQPQTRVIRLPYADK